MISSTGYDQRIAFPPLVAAAIDNLAALLLTYRLRIDLIGQDGRATRVHPHRPRQKIPLQQLMTGAEWRIATMVATGSTNREVAAALNVSAKTVEAHLGHIYRKTGLRSRSELAFSVARCWNGLEAAEA